MLCQPLPKVIGEELNAIEKMVETHAYRVTRKVFEFTKFHGFFSFGVSKAFPYLCIKYYFLFRLKVPVH